ncbi:TonB-dependent siderophore receptor [Steroidobacter flavus]|uniref:TonB-dependent siderophore receptor n=1 Tax=Steroidobacter flavus TaxID=1842136 RepID=A0ABV8T4V4_9GAMM
MTARALFSLLILSSLAHAGSVDFSIERQPLAGALQQLARQADVQVIFFSRVTEGLNAPALAGNYTLEAAMERLLAGSGLTFRIINPQTVEVRPMQTRAAAKPRPISKPKEQPAEATAPLEEVVVVGLAEQLVATRIATPLREIPQTVSIVSGEQMRQRNEVTLSDVLANAPGITMARSNSLDPDFYARAYQITSFHIDGGAAVTPKIDTTVMFLGTPDLIEFDHVEILRGADGLFSGNANPGGTVSLVRKRPQNNFAASVNATRGSWDTQRVELDLTGPIAEDGALRGRMAGVYAHNGYFYDIDAHERKKVFGALEYDVTDSATLTAGASYQWDKASPTTLGLPLYADGRDSRLPRDTALAPDWNRYRADLASVYLQYRQELSPGWALRVNASGWRAEVEYELASFNALIDPFTNMLSMLPVAEAGVTAGPNIHEQTSADVTVTGTLDWFGWREEVAIGADFSRFRPHAHNESYYGLGTAPIDPRAFDSSAIVNPALTRDADVDAFRSSILDQYGMFASLRIYFDDAWSVLGGARISGDRNRSRYIIRVGSRELDLSTDFGTDHVVTPYAGVTYAISRNYSLYASYSDIYRAQGLYDRSPGNPLEPVRGVNIEAGIKGEWRNGAVNGSLAAYRIEQSNLAQLVSTPHDVTTISKRDCCYVGVSNKSQGVDAELSGEVLAGWSLGAGYTYNDNEAPTGGPLSRLTPKHLFKAWTNVRMPGAFDRWQVGGSVHAQSKTTARAMTNYCPAPAYVCLSVDTVQPSYAVLDLRAAFDVDPNWRVALGVSNVFDKIYYEAMESNLHGWYGEPRHWMLRIDGRY